MLILLLLLPLVTGNWIVDHNSLSLSTWQNTLSRRAMHEFEYRLWPRMMAQEPRKKKSQETPLASKLQSASQPSQRPKSGGSQSEFNQAPSSRTSTSKISGLEVSDSKYSLGLKNPWIESPGYSSSSASKPPLSKPGSSIPNTRQLVKDTKASRAGPSPSRVGPQLKDLKTLLEERKQLRPYQMLVLTDPYKKYEPLGESMPWSSVDPSSISSTAKIAAQALQKKLGLDEYPKGDTTYSPENIAKTQRWFDQSKDRVAVAKTRASSDPKYHPIGVDKAKNEAHRRRVKSDEATKKLSPIDTKNIDTININHVIEAKVAGKLDRDAGLTYAEQHSKAATKASNDNRWNDAARHEQASVRTSTRTNLRYQAMKDAKNNFHHRGKIESDKKLERNEMEDLQKKQNKAQISKGEHVMAGHWYQQAREAFSGSDSEEDIPAPSKND